MSNLSINNNNNIISSLFNKVSQNKTLIKIAALAMFIITVTAVIATAAVGLPIMIPLGIGLAGAALEVVLFIAYKCIPFTKPKKTPSSETLPPLSPQTSYIYDPSLDEPPSITLNKPLSNQDIFDILKTNHQLSPSDLVYMRQHFLNQNWERHHNTQEILNQKKLQVQSGGSSNNSILYDRPEYNCILDLSTANKELPNIIKPDQTSSKDRSIYPQGWNFKNIRAIIDVSLPTKPLNILELTKISFKVYMQAMDEPFTLFLPPNTTNLYCLHFESLGIESLQYATPRDKLLAKEACLLGFCMAINQSLLELKDHSNKATMKKIISLNKIQSKI